MTAERPPVVRLRDVTKSYGIGAAKTQVLRGVSFDIEAGELSGGQKQRVAIARALFGQPKLLLCDEPTGNLDSETGKEVIDFFRELNAKDGVTLLIVTHEARVSHAATRVLVLREGRLHADGAEAVETE